MFEIFILLIVFQLKHFIADFPLQGRYMLGKFKGGWEWVLPLSLHAFVHALFTYSISSYCLDSSFIPLLLALLDFTIHFIVDRIKSSPNLAGRWKPDTPWFWWALGADQMAHHLTHYFIIWIILQNI